DQRLCPAGEAGEFVSLFWTHDLAAKRDRNVHFLRASVHDGERARTLPRETGIPGQIAAPLLLEEGRLLAFVVDRGRPGTMRLWQSRDAGATSPEEARLGAQGHARAPRRSRGRE